MLVWNKCTDVRENVKKLCSYTCAGKAFWLIILAIVQTTKTAKLTYKVTSRVGNNLKKL